MRTLPSFTSPIALILSLAVSSPTASADEPLHATIDRLIAARTPNYEQIAAPIAPDGEFLRRVSLDLTGMLPTTEQTRQFLADSDPDKRAELVDRLLASPEYARHMQREFDVILMRRLPVKNVTAAEWQAFLRQSFAANKPWDQLTREILAADGSDAKNRGPARFYLDRNGEVNEITRDIGRVFLGADLECAQCHDHPEIDDYKQHHYYGLSAFLVRSFVFTDPKAKKAVFAEKAEGEVTFQSVFDTEAKERTTVPVLFDGKPIDEPQFGKDEAYQVKPAKNVRPIPKFSRRSQLPERLATADNERFVRTGANRLWALMLGRGIVHPVDRDHSDNPPSHPELLQVLTEQFAAHGFDIKFLLREIALSDTYQRSSFRPGHDEPADEAAFAQAIVRPLSPEQLAWSVLQATGEADAQRAALGDKLTEAELHKRLAGHETRFVRQFGGEPGQPPADFEATVDQVLFLSNDPGILAVMRSKPGGLADRLSKLPPEDPQAIAEELFLSVFVRLPSEDEVRDVTEYLAGREDAARKAAADELVWALVTSSEFRFNH